MYIIPRKEKLTLEEYTVYLEIAKRLLIQFMPSAKYELTEIITRIENYLFITKGKILLDEGYLRLLNKNKEDKEEEKEDKDEKDDDNKLLNIKININDTVKEIKSNIIRK